MAIAAGSQYLISDGQPLNETAMLLDLVLAVAGLGVPLQGKEHDSIPPMPHMAACALAGAEQFDHISDLPPEAAEEISTLFREGMSEAETAFNATDVIGDHPIPQRRFLRAYQKRNTWIVWYEHGGRGYHLHAVGLMRRPGQGKADISSSAAFTGENSAALCAASRAFLGGVHPSSEM